MPASDAPDPLEKLRSDGLKRAVLDVSSNPQTVIVELALPLPRVVVSPRGSNVMRRPAAVESVSAHELETRVSEALRAIAQVGVEAGPFIPSAHALVVDATGRQLRSLAELPAVRAIWPNERR
jgi:hypothetical protein